LNLTKNGDTLFSEATKQRKTNMSPLGIVRDIRTIVQKQLMPQVPKRWSKQVSFGIKAYSLRSFASAGSNARKVVGNVHTASTKADRLLANLKLANHFGTVFDVLGLVYSDSFVNIDHSDMNGLMALVGAVQTRRDIQRYETHL
jgi:hypothetical protein